MMGTEEEGRRADQNWCMALESDLAIDWRIWRRARRTREDLNLRPPCKKKCETVGARLHLL